MTISSFYSDRTNGSVARANEVLPEVTAHGLKALVQRRIAGDWLARDFPSNCPDGNSVAGTNTYDLGPDLSALIPGVSWPLWQEAISDETLFDVVEYTGQRLAKPSHGAWHEYFKHFELEFDENAGRRQFREDVNMLLSRGGTVFEMNAQMEIQRVGSPEVRTALRQLVPNTGDSTLDSLFTTGRDLYLSRSPSDRGTAIEKLWDGFERLKTIDAPGNKKQSVLVLLGHIADPAFRGVVETEMTALTSLGNNFQIRHHEVGKDPIPTKAQDYVAARMVNLILLLLTESNRL